MMDITKSREEFEKWANRLPSISITGRLERCGENYVDDYHTVFWLAWQASRESIENKAPPKIENHMSQPIAVLDISSRTKNAILNGGISTIGDLLRIGHLGVLKVPGIGRGCEEEIKSALVNLSIEWKPWGESE